MDAAGFQTIDGTSSPGLDGDHPDNLGNRTLLRMGGQLELTTELGQSLFTDFTGRGRPGSANDAFWNFTAACRSAIADLEANQPIP